MKGRPGMGYTQAARIKRKDRQWRRAIALLVTRQRQLRACWRHSPLASHPMRFVATRRHRILRRK